MRRTLVFTLRTIALTNALCASACGDGDFGVGPHSPLPVVQNLGGPVLASPRFAAITFSSDPYSADIDKFLEQLGQSSYWTVVYEYGIGPATSTSTHVTDPPPPTIDGPTAEAYLLAHLDPLAAGWPAPDGNTAYVMYYPADTTFSSCSQVAGFHSSIVLASGVRVAYAVIPRCSYGIDQFEEITEVSTHELVETATDPIVDLPAYATSSDFTWQQRAGGGEIADMCQGTPGAYVRDASVGHYVQRVWSNAAAEEGHDPCVPHLPGDVYFQAAPAATDTVTLTFKDGSPNVTTSGVMIPLHTSRIVDVQLFSDGPTAPISVFAEQWPVDARIQEPHDIELSFDSNLGYNNDTVHLKIDVNADSYGEGHEYVIVTAQIGDLWHDWPIVIQN